MIGNAWKHFKLITKHKLYVFYYCCIAGIPLRGLIHDVSKYSPTEFFESAKYFQGDSSPINACKKANGYSKAWLHHKGRNSHHYEYWQDNFDRGGEALQMPFEDALELICDYLAAGRAYGSNFTYSGEYQWWKSKTANPIAMHPQTKLFVEYMLSDMAKEESSRCLHPFSASRKYHFAEYVIKTGG